MLDPDKVLAEVKGRGCKTVGLQFPEGLKNGVLGIAERLQDEGFEVVLDADACYGACDLRSMPCDLLIHFGHAPLGLDKKNVIFEEVHINCDLKVLEKCIPMLKSPVGLVTNVQHVHQLPQIKEYLEEKGQKVIMGQGDQRIKHQGQVLGCDFSAAIAIKDDARNFLYFGTGDFHPLGVALATNMDVIAADPFSNEVKNMSALRDKFMRQRFAAIELASKAERFGILVSKKSGQMRLNLAKKLEEDLVRAGKKAFILYLDNIIPENLEGYGFDAFVGTACPRIAIDDYLRFKKPIINPKELEIVLGKHSWADYELDEI